jgi:hypothetical protein
VGQGSTPEGRAIRKTPRSAKLFIILQSLLIMFLGYWAVEEYRNNVYFQSYVNATIGANMLLLSGIVVGVPVLAIAAVAMRRRRGRSTRLVDVDLDSQGAPSPLRQPQSAGESQSVSPIVAALSSRFLNQTSTDASTSTGTSQNVGQGKMPVLQRLNEAASARPKPVDTSLPFLERTEHKQERVETKPVQAGIPRYQSPSTSSSTSDYENAASYRPTLPSYSRPAQSPVPARPSSAAPMARPPTVVTGVMGQGPRQFPSPPPPSPGPIPQGQRQMVRPYQDHWEPGVRPTGPLGAPPSKPTQFSPLGSNRPGGLPENNPVRPVPPLLGRIGPTTPGGDKAAVVEASQGLNRVEPVQALANQRPTLKGQPSPLPSGGSKSEPLLPTAESDVLSDVLGKQKTGLSQKRDEKKDTSGQ